MASVTGKFETNENLKLLCSFCGNTRNDVATLLVSGESVICDVCAVTALDTLSRQPGQQHVRVAFRLFQAVASTGRFLRRG